MACSSPVSAADQPLYNAILAQRDAMQQQDSVIVLQIAELTLQHNELVASIAAADTQLAYMESGSVPVSQLADVTNFALTAESDLSVTAAWDAVSDADTYVIERALDAAFTQECTIVFDGAYPGGGEYNDTSVLPLVKYFYRIQAQADGYQPSDWEADSVTPNAGQLTTPTFDTPVILSNSILVTWLTVSDATSYLLERSDDNNTWSPVYEGGELEYNDDALNSGSTYYYRLTARNQAGGYLDSAVATDDWTTALSVVPDVTGLSSEYAGTDAVYITWDDVPVATEFVLQRADDVAFTVNPTTLYTGDYSGSQPYNDGGVTDGNTYYYRVKASRDGWTDSNWVVISVLVLPQLDTPTGFTAFFSGPEWQFGVNDMPNATTYVLEALGVTTELVYTGNRAGLISGGGHTTTMPFNDIVAWRVKTQASGYVDSEWAYYNV